MEHSRYIYNTFVRKIIFVLMSAIRAAIIIIMTMMSAKRCSHRLIYGTVSMGHGRVKYKQVGLKSALVYVQLRDKAEGADTL